MSEPIVPVAALATGGLTILGFVTGLHPMLLVAGFVGSWWYNSYRGSSTLLQRLSTGIIAALVAAWMTPPLVIFASSLAWWPAAVPAILVGFPAALALGFLTHKVIGPTLLRVAEKKSEDLA